MVTLTTPQGNPIECKFWLAGGYVIKTYVSQEDYESEIESVRAYLNLGNDIHFGQYRFFETSLWSISETKEVLMCSILEEHVTIPNNKIISYAL